MIMNDRAQVYYFFKKNGRAKSGLLCRVEDQHICKWHFTFDNVVGKQTDFHTGDEVNFHWDKNAQTPVGRFPSAWGVTKVATSKASVSVETLLQFAEQDETIRAIGARERKKVSKRRNPIAGKFFRSCGTECEVIDEVSTGYVLVKRSGQQVLRAVSELRDLQFYDSVEELRQVTENNDGGAR